MTFEFNPFTGNLEIAKTEFVNFLTFKSTITDAFKVTQQFSTTVPTQYTFTNKTNNPNFYVRMPDGFYETNTGVDFLAGGDASDVIFQIGSGGNSDSTDGNGGNGGNFIVKLGQEGVGQNGPGNLSQFFIKNSVDATILSVGDGTSTFYGALTVTGTLNLLANPYIEVTATNNSNPIDTFNTTAKCSAATVAGFGSTWVFTTQANNSTSQTGRIINTLLAVSPHVHSRMTFSVRSQTTFAEGFRFESDLTNDAVALCALGGVTVASTKCIIYTQKAGNAGLAIRATASQTGDLQRWLDSSGATQLAIAANGSDFTLNVTTGTKIGTSTSQKLGFWNATPVVQNTGWNPTNVTTDRAFDASATTLAEIANVLGTLINQLKTYGLLGG